MTTARSGPAVASATPYRVCLWDAAGGKRLAEFDRLASGAVAFDLTGKRLVTAGQVTVIDPERRKIVRSMGQGASFAEAVAVSPDGKTIASNGVYDERIRLWDADTGNEKLVAGHLDEVRSVAFSRDGKWEQGIGVTFSERSDSPTARVETQRKESCVRGGSF